MVPAGAGAARPALEKASHGLTNLRLTLMFHHSQVRQSSRCPSLGQPPNPIAMCPVPHLPCPMPCARPDPPQPLRNLAEKAEKQPLGSAFPQQHFSSSPSRLDPRALRGTAPSQRDAGGEVVFPWGRLDARGQGCCRGKGVPGRAEPLPAHRLRRAGSSPSTLSPSFSFPPLHVAGVAHGSTQDCFWARHPEVGTERGRRRNVSPGWGRAAMDQLNGRVRGLNSRWWIFLSVLSGGTGTLVLWRGCLWDLPDPPNIPSLPALHAAMWALSY